MALAHESVSSGTSRDRREGGRWTRAQIAKNFVIALLVRAAFLVADRVPAPRLIVIGRALGWVAARVLRTARRVAYENARQCWPPDEAHRLSQRSFVRAGENLAVSLLLRRPGTRALDWVEVPETSREALAGALRLGNGAVFVSAHLGPFEFVAAAIAELGAKPSIVVRESYDPRLDPWIDAHRLARGVDVIHRGAPNVGRRIVRALKSGHPVGLLPDLGGRVPSLPVTFAGGVTDFPVGPAKLATRFGSALLLGTLVRKAPLYSVSGVPTEPPFLLHIFGLDATGNAGEITQRVATALDGAIRQAPEDWLWMAKRSRILEGEEARTDPRRQIAEDSRKTLHSSTALAVPQEP